MSSRQHWVAEWWLACLPLRTAAATLAMQSWYEVCWYAVVSKCKCARRLLNPQIVKMHCNDDWWPSHGASVLFHRTHMPVCSLALPRPAALLGERSWSQLPLALFHVSSGRFMPPALHCIHSVKKAPQLSNLRLLPTPFPCCRPRGACCPQYIDHPAGFCYKLPPGISHEEGAMCEPLSVGVHAVRRGGVMPGTDVAVIGAGPIGGSLWPGSAKRCPMCTVHSEKRCAMWHATPEGMQQFEQYCRDPVSSRPVASGLSGSLKLPLGFCRGQVYKMPHTLWCISLRSGQLPLVVFALLCKSAAMPAARSEARNECSLHAFSA